MPENEIGYYSAEIMTQLRCPHCFANYNDTSFELTRDSSMAGDDDIKVRVGEGGECFNNNGYRDKWSRQGVNQPDKPTLEVVKFTMRRSTRALCGQCGNGFRLMDVFLEEVRGEWFTIMIEDDPSYVPNNVQRSLSQRWLDYCWSGLNPGIHDFGSPAGATIRTEQPGFDWQS